MMMMRMITTDDNAVNVSAANLSYSFCDSLWVSQWGERCGACVGLTLSRPIDAVDWRRRRGTASC